MPGWTDLLLRKLLSGLIWTVVVQPEALVAHDLYTNLRDPAGRNCCTDEDCRPANYTLVPGGAVFHPTGHEDVFVPTHRIVFAIVPGDPVPQAHWCGRPKTQDNFVPPRPDDPDPRYMTFCAFIPPGQF